jgi:hypothetical protein
MNQLSMRQTEFHAVKPGLMTALSKGVVATQRLDPTTDSTLSELASDIETAYKNQLRQGSKTVEAIIEVGHRCQRAMDYIQTLGNDLKHTNDLEKMTPLSKASISKYASIVGNRIITDAKNHSMLPISVFSLYELTLLDEAKLQAAITAGEITPESTRADIAKMKGELSDEPQSKPPAKLAAVDIFTISLPVKTWAQTYEVFEEGLQELLTTHHAKLAYSKDVEVKKIDSLRKRAQEEYRVHKLNSNPKLSNLVDNAIHECYKHGKKVPVEATGKEEWELSPDWTQYANLCAELDLTTPVYGFQIYRAAKAKKIASYRITASYIDPELGLWHAVLNICDNRRRQALKKKIETACGKTEMPNALQKVAREIHEMVRYL